MPSDDAEIESDLQGHSHHTTTTFFDSSFFRESPGSTLPSPTEVRAINEESGDIRGKDFGRPPPVKFPSLGLIVKYGGQVTTTEAATQHMVYNMLKGKVPTPEVYGWTKDRGQLFIYMSLVGGDTLEQRWGDLTDEEKRAIFKQLRGMVESWRSLRYPHPFHYVGSLDGQPLNDIFCMTPRLAGPFCSEDAVHNFHRCCDMDIDGDVPTVFTHADLVPPNIILSSGKDPVVAAIIDWGQSGWYPIYWEYCKSHTVRSPNMELWGDDFEEEWNTKYLPSIVDPVDNDEIYNHWMWFLNSVGM